MKTWTATLRTRAQRPKLTLTFPVDGEDFAEAFAIANENVKQNYKPYELVRLDLTADSDEPKRAKAYARGSEMKVTLEASDNTYLTYPCCGFLEPFETGSNGSLIKAVFRKLDQDGCFDGGPVEVRNPIFRYTPPAR